MNKKLSWFAILAIGPLMLGGTFGGTTFAGLETITTVVTNALPTH